MKSFDQQVFFSTEVFGKWILAGEHAVIRGYPAIVFPLKSHSLTLNFFPDENIAETEFIGLHDNDLHLLFWGVIERGLALTQHEHREITGRFRLENSIPLGAGMGASAALCVAVGRFFLYQNWIQENELFNFSHQLEHLFHGESSGVDIAVSLHHQGLLFKRGQPPRFLKPTWTPKWYLSSTEQVAITSNCVKKVHLLHEQNSELAKRIDETMNESVMQALDALHQSDVGLGRSQLASAINLAHLCFAQWGLAGGKVERHINQLLEAGALAAKLTGAGDGGFVLSLWTNTPPPTLSITFYKL